MLDGLFSSLSEIYGVDYYNNILECYVITKSGKYEKVIEVELVPLNEKKEIEVYEYDGSKKNVTLNENTKVLYIDGYINGYVLPNIAYGQTDGGICIGLEKVSNFSANQKVIEKNGNLYELVENGEVKLGTIITGYEANGYSGEWMIYNITSEGVKIAPYYKSWNVKYEYQMEKTNQENLNNVIEECEKYLNSNLAIKAEILTKEETNAVYNIPESNEGTRNHLKNVYVKNGAGELTGLNYLGYGEFQIDSAIQYKIVPVITLDKDVKITAGEYLGKIYK